MPSGQVGGVEVATTIAGILDLAERGMHHSRRALGRAQLQVHAWRLSVDPGTRAWMAEARRGLADGSLDADAFGRDDLLALLKAARLRQT